MKLSEFQELIEKEKRSGNLLVLEEELPKGVVALFRNGSDPISENRADLFLRVENDFPEEYKLFNRAITDLKRIRFKKALKKIILAAKEKDILKYPVEIGYGGRQFDTALAYLHDLLVDGSITITFKEDLKYESNERSSPKYLAWRGAVLLRDNFVCMKCQSKNDLIAHHILNYSEHPEKSTDVSNGITLCKPCHVEYHNKYGVTGCCKEDLMEFLISNVDGDI